MPKKKRRTRKKKKNSRHILFILLLVLAGVFFLSREPGREKTPSGLLKPFKTEKKSGPAGLPKVAIVMDDLGNSKKMAKTIFEMKQPLTFSVLPLQTYSRWTAEEAYRRGYDVILHIPMESSRKMKLGEGGLYLDMSHRTIRETLETDIDSVPFIIGASSHMGSAFTRDRRAMDTVVSVLKDHDLFFLDSITIPDTVGYSIAKRSGLAALRRDIFLDNSDDLKDIAHQWKELMTLAKKKGYAVALAHPRKNTFTFLKKTLKNNKEISVVPLSELINNSLQ